jgi:hypothetical protein
VEEYGSTAVIKPKPSGSIHGRWNCGYTGFMLSQPLSRLALLLMLSRNHKIRESHGPLQSNGICSLDLPFHSQLKPIASTSSAMALPHVATVPGPVSLPGGLIV